MDIIYMVYAEVNENNHVVRFFSTCNEEPQPYHIFVKDGVGLEFVDVSNYELIDELSCYNYKNDNGIIVERSVEDKLQELNNRPKTELQLIHDQLNTANGVLVNLLINQL